MDRRGRIICVEGLNGSGKTTVCQELVKKPGRKYVKLPRRDTDIGKIIDAYLHNERRFHPSASVNERCAQLLFAANALDALREIHETLASGVDVVMDRYLPSSVAYYAASAGCNVQNAAEFIFGIQQSMPPPDIILFLEVPPELAVERCKSRGTKEERNHAIEAQRKVAHAYGLTLGKVEVFENHWIVDASRELDQVLGECERLIASELGRNQ